MSFTTSLPTQPGFYWVKNQSYPNAVIVQVQAQGFGVNTAFLTGCLFINGFDIDGTEQWEGPLSPS